MIGTQVNVTGICVKVLTESSNCSVVVDCWGWQGWSIGANAEQMISKVVLDWLTIQTRQAAVIRNMWQWLKFCTCRWTVASLQISQTVTLQKVVKLKWHVLSLNAQLCRVPCRLSSSDTCLIWTRRSSWSVNVNLTTRKWRAGTAVRQATVMTTQQKIITTLLQVLPARNRNVSLLHGRSFNGLQH